MSGFTLGEEGGGTLGSASGGTLGIPLTEWRLDGYPVISSQTEVATSSALTLTFRVSSTMLEQRLRPLKSDEGKVALLGKDDGGFVAVDRANGNNTFTLNPPAKRKPLRQKGTYHVQRYEENLVSQTVEEWDVEIEFVKDADRTDTPAITDASQYPDSTDPDGGTLGDDGGFTLGGEGGATVSTVAGVGDRWIIDTQLSTLITDRVDAEVLGTGRDGVRRFELITRLTDQQAHVFEAALARIRGTRVKEVPDAPNVMVDETGGDATLTVDAPDGQSAVSDGQYVVTEWESRRVTDAYQEISVVLAET